MSSFQSRRAPPQIHRRGAENTEISKVTLCLFWFIRDLRERSRKTIGVGLGLETACRGAIHRAHGKSGRPRSGSMNRTPTRSEDPRFEGACRSTSQFSRKLRKSLFLPHPQFPGIHTPPLSYRAPRLSSRKLRMNLVSCILCVLRASAVSSPWWKGDEPGAHGRVIRLRIARAAAFPSPSDSPPAPMQEGHPDRQGQPSIASVALARSSPWRS